MSLIIKRSWNPDGSEKKILDYLKKLFKNEKEDILLFHNILVDNIKSEDKLYPIKPDIILLSKSRGIALIEIKSWLDFNVENNFVKLSNGEKALNPIITAQNYYFNFHRIIRSRNSNLNLHQLNLRCHLLFINQIYNPDLTGRYFDTHFINYSTTLTKDAIFNNSPLEEDIYQELLSFLDPSNHFSVTKQSTLEKCYYELDDKQTQIINKNPYGHYLVSGIPGSGKSILVVSRAIYLQELFPHWKILIICTNRNLSEKHKKDLTSRLGESATHNIYCKTYISFLSELVPNKDLLKDIQQLSRYEEKINRYKEYAIPTPRWDAILVDEYQDFNKSDFSIILKSCNEFEALINKEVRKTQNLFLAGDMLQKIREDGCCYSWDDMNIYITGRSTTLKSSYRCTSEILKVSLEYLKKSNNTLKDEVKRFYDGTDDIIHREVYEPSIHFSDKWISNEIVELGNNVQILLKQNVPPCDIIIIAPTHYHAELNFIFKEYLKEGLLITGHHTVKGLESSYVFVLNLPQMIKYLHDSPTTKARMIYMIMTRANKHIEIHSSDKNDPDYLKLIELVKDVRERNLIKKVFNKLSKIF